MKTEYVVVPRDWQTVQLSDISEDFLGGGTPSTANERYWNGKIPWMTSAHISSKIITTGQRYITDEGLNNSSTNLVPKNNILVATRVGIGKVAINGVDMAISQDLTGIILKKEKVVTDYVYWQLLFRLKKYKALSQGSTIKGVLKKDLAKLEIPLPKTKSEQQKIAEILSTVDDAIQKSDEIIQKTQLLKKGLLHQLLTRGIGHSRFKQTEIGEIPEEWEVINLQDVVSINPESLDPTTKWPDKEFDYVDIEAVKEGRIVAPRRIIGKDAPSRARRVIREKDVIMSTVRPYLKAFTPISRKYDGCICSTGFAVLRPTEQVDHIYLFYAILSERTIMQCNAMMRGGQYPALNQSQVEQLIIPLPTLPEQQKIAEILSTVDKKIEAETERKERLQKIKVGLMNDLLTGKRRVKVEA